MRFSVIIPLFNKEQYLKRSLGSVIDQSFKDFELIVIDDGSTDGSYDLAKDILESSRIDYHLIRQENMGVSTARNNGVTVSTGDYICFLDADDWWDPAFLEKIDQLIKEYPQAGIYGTNYYYVKNGRQRVCVTTAQTGYINYCKVYAERLQMPLTSISVAIPQQVFIDMGGFKPNLKLGEDFDLWVRIALTQKVAFLDEPLAYYYQDSDPKWRGTGHLIPPHNHMLWNLDYLEPEERKKPEYKRLIDNLRTYSLFPYYLSKQYRYAAKQELAKVDWELQPRKVLSRYNKPILVLKFECAFKRCGSTVKKWAIKHWTFFRQTGGESFYL